MASRSLLHIALAAILAACSATPSAQPTPQAQTILIVDGRTLTLPAGAPADVLAAAGVSLQDGDDVHVDGSLWRPGTATANPAVIEVRRARSISIREGGQTPYSVNTSADTVGGALWDAGMQLREADRVEPSFDTPLDGVTAITLTRAVPLTIQIDGAVVRTLSAADRVADALADAGIGLTGADYTTPPADGPLPADGAIQVVRVREEILATQTIERADTIFQALADQPIDTRQQIDAGADGIRRTYTRVRYEDGFEISRVTEAEFIAQTPRPRVVGYGTQITVNTLATPDGAIEYWRSYDVYATSYSPSRAGVPTTSRSFGITRSGQRLVKGLIAVDPRYIPLGTRLYIPGYGFAVAADTGGGVKGRFVDLGYSDNDYQSWARVVKIYFLTPAPPAGSIVWLIPQSIP